MKKKYRVIDDTTGESLTVEELEKDSDIDETETDCNDEETGLSADEIAALKKLAAVADKLVAMTTTTDADEDEDEEDIGDEDEVVEESEDDDEVVVDTEEETLEKTIEKKTTDSKRSFGKIEKKKQTRDADIDHEEDVASAWAKRYGGNK